MGFHVGQTFGEYSITALLGAGGMGRVYRVEHRLTRRTEAMKVLAAELATETQIKRFEREMQVLARLSHPNIAVLHNALHSENQLILLMEYIEGRTLESILGAGRVAAAEAVEYIRQILSALDYAHRQGVVHRDVTPANVIVTESGEVKLTDFGLSKSFGDPLLTRGGEILGSLPYMAPEQVKRTSEPDGRSDLFSVGAILYEALTGQKPFGLDRRLAPVLTDSESDPQPPSQLDPSLSKRWDEIVGRALARDPQSRYQSADEFLNAVSWQERAHPAKSSAFSYRRAIGSTVAIMAGLLLALVATPAASRLRAGATAAPRFEIRHIAPPDFAFFTTPAAKPISRPRSGKRERVGPSRREPNTLDSMPFESDQTEISRPAATNAKAKGRFWGKLNPFKKKKKDLPE